MSNGLSQKIQQIGWITFAIIFLFASFVFLIGREKQADLVLIEKEAEPEIEVQLQPEKVAVTTQLGRLTDEVRPLDLTTRVVGSDVHEAEFRGTKFIDEHRGLYTVELFRAFDEDVVKGFLRKQPSRDGLFYIRLAGDKKTAQYIVLYGQFKLQSDAESRFADSKITLPASVTPKVIKIAEYLPLVNDLGSDELGLNEPLYTVILKPAAVPITLPQTVTPAPKQNVVTNEQTATVATVTRKDQNGAVVAVENTYRSASANP